MSDEDRIRWAKEQGTNVWYGTFFDHAYCSATTKRGQPCHMVPAWVERDTGRQLCHIHANVVFNQRRKEMEVSHE